MDMTEETPAWNHGADREREEQEVQVATEGGVEEGRRSA